MGFSEFPSLLAYFTDFSLDILNSVAAEVSKCDVTWDESQYDDIQRIQRCIIVMDSYKIVSILQY